MEMTIKQLANELKVGKTTINRVIAQLDLQDKLHKTGNRYMLSETQIEQIKLKISHQSNHDRNQTKQTMKLNQIHQKQTNPTMRTNQNRTNQTKRTKQTKIYSCLFSIGN